MTTLLPVALRGIKTELVRDAVTSLCLFFNAIEHKVIDEEKPLFTVTRYQAMYINGYTLYTMARYKKSVYQNSGVRVRAVVDDSPDDDDTETNTYYGQIEEIWELDYVGLKVSLFQCRWVINRKRAVRRTNMVILVLISGSLVTKNEPFFSANDVEQVFYLPNLAKKNWSVVMPGKKIVGVENVVEEDEYNKFDEIPSSDTSYKA
jgi:hypothetical protein